MSDFDFKRTATRPQPKANPVALWFARASATFVGAFLAGLLLLLIVRWYVVESVRELLAKPTEEIRKIR